MCTLVIGNQERTHDYLATYMMQVMTAHIVAYPGLCVCAVAPARVPEAGQVVVVIVHKVLLHCVRVTVQQRGQKQRSATEWCTTCEGLRFRGASQRAIAHGSQGPPPPRTGHCAKVRQKQRHKREIRGRTTTKSHEDMDSPLFARHVRGAVPKRASGWNQRKCDFTAYVHGRIKHSHLREGAGRKWVGCALTSAVTC